MRVALEGYTGSIRICHIVQSPLTAKLTWTGGGCPFLCEAKDPSLPTLSWVQCVVIQLRMAEPFSLFIFFMLSPGIN